MAYRVDPSLMYELKEFGAAEIEKCFNCGNCTAICPLAEDNYPFPGGTIRNIRLALKDRRPQGLIPGCATTAVIALRPAPNKPNQVRR